jgi:hypothetical protein
MGQQEHFRFARARFGTYETIDFVVVRTCTTVVQAHTHRNKIITTDPTG